MLSLAVPVFPRTLSRSPVSRVTGYNRDYLWFLSRTPEVSEKAIEAFKDRARAEGFDLEELIVVEQEKHRSQR